MCTVVRDFSGGWLSNKYWAVWVETFRPVMSQISHPTPSTGRGSAEISQAERLKGKGIEPESMETQELTHQPLHDCGHYKRLARTRAWHYVASSEHSSRCSFSPSLYFLFSFLCLCVSLSVWPPVPQIKPTNLTLTSLAPIPGAFSSPPPYFFLPSPFPCLFHDIFFSSCWVMSARIVTFFVLPESSNNSMTNSW